MRIEEMLDIKSRVRQPILRKDFILKEYQIYQSRAFGADAVLLMANVLSGEKMRRFYELAQELGLDAVLVGTSLLKAPAGIHEILAEFEAAVRQRTNHNAPLVEAATA